MNTPKYNRLPLFILTFGIALGLVFLVNIALVPVIGPLAMLTLIPISLTAMYLMIKLYKRFIGVDLKIIPAFLIYIPIVFIGGVLFRLGAEIDFEGTTETYYPDGYSMHLYDLIKESFVETLPTAAIFAFLLVPLYNRLSKKFAKTNESPQ